MRFSLRVALLLGAVVIAIVPAGPALGHASYESSDPPDDGTVSSPPSEVTADFTEPLQADSYMDVTDPCGRDVGGDTSITADTMTVQMSGSAEGEYVIRWRAHSSVDNHITTGDFSFTSTGGDPCPGEEPPEEDEASEKESSAGSSSGGSAAGSGASGDQSGSNGSSGAAGPKGGGEPGDRQAGDSRGGGKDRVTQSDEATIDGSELAAVAAAEEEQPTPSALDGMPLGGLVVTLSLAALIGAAAGKVYFSLSGERE